MGAPRRLLSPLDPEDSPHAHPTVPTKVVVELSLTHPATQGSRADAIAPSPVREPSLGELCRLLEHAGLIPGQMVGRASDHRSLSFGLKVKAIRFPHKHPTHHPGEIPDASDGPLLPSSPVESRSVASHSVVSPIVPPAHARPTLAAEHAPLDRSHRH